MASSFRLRLGLLIGWLAAAPAARAEVIELADSSKVAGKILHFYDGMFTVEVASGQRLQLPANKIKTIVFKLPPPRAELSTPQKTFERYKEALGKSDWQRAVDCMALMYQGSLAMQVGQATDELKKMQKEFEGSRFDLKSMKVNGASAVLKVQRQKGDDVETTDVRLVLENGEWKLVP